MKKIFKNIILVPALVLGLSSCTDWLDVKPTTSIVSEDMWKDQSDVEAVVASIYNQMLQNDFMQRVILWGELRSDNMIHNDAPSTDPAKDQRESYKSISLSSIQENNGVASWAPIYKVISLCNFVIEFAPGVCDIDPDYIVSQMNAHVAEARAIRALCYFYLVRTFTHFPYVDKPVLDDQEDLQVPPVAGETVIPKIIADLEDALNKAQSQYPSILYTKFRINRNAVAAILADVYLWKASGEDYPNDSASYEKVIEYCDRIFQDTIVSLSGITASNEYLTLYPNGEYYTRPPYGADYYSHNFENTLTSLETIFALRAEQQSMWEQNKDNLVMVNLCYGNDATTSGTRGDIYTTYKCAPNEKYPKPSSYTSKEAPFYLPDNNQSMDVRYGYNNYFWAPTNSLITSNGAPIWKYHYTGNGFQNYPNWVFYRLAEVYLMKAEAIVEKMNANYYLDQNGTVQFHNYPVIDENDSEEVIEAKQELQDRYDEEMLKAYLLVTRIYRRANVSNNLSPAFRDYSSDMASLVFAERRREFMFEGKRWYDLMRIARRDYKRDITNGNKTLIDCVKTKLDEGADLIASRLSTMNSLYWPINKSELDRNPNLTQNIYYQSETSNIEK